MSGKSTVKGWFAIARVLHRGSQSPRPGEKCGDRQIAALVAKEQKTRDWIGHGFRMRFEWEDYPVLEEAVSSVVLPDWEPSDAGQPDAVFTLRMEDAEQAVVRHVEAGVTSAVRLSFLHNELRRLCHLELATNAPDLVFVHSGVVLTDFGVVVIPARTYSGKSTLVKSLIERGLRFFSDEYAVVDKDGLVRPFPRRHCQRLAGGKEAFTPATELGWEPSFRASPVCAVIVTRYSEGAVWSPQPLSPGQAVVKLLENTVSARTEPARALSYLTRMVEHARCVEGPRGEADESARMILDWLASLPNTGEVSFPEPPAPPNTPPPAPPLAAAAPTAAEPDDDEAEFAAE